MRWRGDAEVGSLNFVFKHALREGRATWKRLGLYMSSITLGVAALVAINSFRTNAVDSVDEQSRALLGADLRLSSNRAFPGPIELLLDSAESRHDVARVTTIVSMGVAAHSGDTRLVQLRAIQAGYPFYGEVTTEPRGAWRALHQQRSAVADEPTGNLDAETGRRIIDLLVELNAAARTTLILVTHDLELAALAHRVVRLAGGHVVSDEVVG